MRLFTLALFAASFLVAFPAVEVDDVRRPGRYHAVSALARLVFVPLGEVRDPHLLWIARLLLGLGLVFAVVLFSVTSVRVRRIRERRGVRRSGNPSVRSARREP